MGGQYHHELIKYCPPSYVLCVSSHFWPFTIVKFVLEKLDKNLGLADPPPQLGQNPKFFQKFDLKAPLSGIGIDVSRLGEVLSTMLIKL